jgi:hypothetical protein
MKGKSLGTITEIIESVNMDVSYAYDDLIFLEQPEYLLQFTKNKKEVLVHVNEYIREETLKISLHVLQKRAKEYTMHFIRGSYFRVNKTDKEHLHVELITIQ